MKKKEYYGLGLMSGSSLDGLDVAWCRFEYSGKKEQAIKSWELLQAETIPFSPIWVNRLAKLPEQSALVYAKTHTYFGYYMAELVNQFIAKHNIEPDFIGSHGHTIYHYPDKLMTAQIGSGAALAALTGYPVVSDFRSQDVALRGEGTPLAPIADRILYNEYDLHLNIGGIANITCRTKTGSVAFDVAPANQVLNRLAQQLGKPYDDKGQWAASGKLDKALFEQLNDLEYFNKDYPKSLDNLWILKNVFPLYIKSSESIEDKLHTACQHLAFQTAQSIEHILKKEKLRKRAYKMLITGGGAFNEFLIDCLRQHCQPIKKLEIIIPDIYTIQYKEAILMALMALLRIHNKPNCLASVTGAQYSSVGGAIYQGRKKTI